MDKRGLILDNIPNFLTISRFIFTFVVMYMIASDANIISIIIVFAIAASTDFFDGVLARRFGWVTEFGRRADMIADRFLWIGTAGAFVIVFASRGNLDWIHFIQLIIMMSRELISAPFAFIAFFSGNPLPQARYIAKVTTFLQGFALPAVILSIYYPIFIFVSVPLSIAAAITGFMSAMYYLNDIHAPKRKRKTKK